MREHLQANRMANKIRMLRLLDPEKAFVLVEGVTDDRFYAKFFDAASCAIEVAMGKHHVEDALALLNEDAFSGVVGIVDADFGHLERSSKQELSHLFFTDYHDIETMILSTDALHDIVAEYVDDRQYEAQMLSKGMSIRDVVVRAGSYLGALRFLSMRDGLQFAFDGVRYEEMFQPVAMEVTLDSVLDTVLRHSKRELTSDEYVSIRDRMYHLVQSEDPWQLSRGHDLVGFLYVLLRYSGIGASNTRSMQMGQLEGSLRLAYDTSYFKTTQLYRSLVSWEQTHAPFRLFGMTDEAQVV